MDKIKNDNLDNEFIKQFDNCFSFLVGKRIVLYGIGYRTGALIRNLGKKYNFVGLMDKEPDNIGKTFFDTVVLDNEYVINHADCIIIISVSYYEVIYKRISSLEEYGIDIYYPNGKMASLENGGFEKFSDDYYNLTKENVCKQIEQYDVISFDIFDTLLMRRVLDSNTVLQLVEYRLRQELEIDFFKLRKQAYANAAQKKIPSIDDVYHEFEQLSGLSHAKVQQIKELEVKSEKRSIVPRNEMVQIFEYALASGKEVCIVSDMYLGTSDLKSIFLEHKINCDRVKFFVSCEYNCDKESGGLWKEVKKEYKQKRIIHFGDNICGDVQMARNCEIDVCHIYSAREMMRHTVLNKLLSLELTLWNQITVGFIMTKLFNSPFCNQVINSKGEIVLDSAEKVGYLGYAPLVFSYILWIVQYCTKNQIKKLVFCARDGYFLKEDTDYFLNLSKQDGKFDTRYLKISRQIIRRATIFDENSIEECILIPFRGTYSEFFQRRFGIELSGDMEIELPEDSDQVMLNSMIHKNEIIEKSEMLRRNYLNYFKEKIGEMKDAALIDFGYSGSSQYYLSKLLNQNLLGLYILADLENTNEFNRNQTKESYLFNEDDLSGSQTLMSKLFSVLESVFTAPYGTFISCNSNGIFETAEDSMNQKFFSQKIEINMGIKNFIKEVYTYIHTYGCDLGDMDFKDQIGQEMLSMIFSEGFYLSRDILNSFYTDDIYKFTTDRPIFD
jgi:predicted HAD superfamily hydrolase